MNVDWKDWLNKAKEEQKDEKWNFSKFKIKCSKCNSFNVEINGEAESEGGYYGSHSLNFNLLVKCHDCGNAMVINGNGDDLINFSNNPTNKYEVLK